MLTASVSTNTLHVKNFRLKASLEVIKISILHFARCQFKRKLKQQNLKSIFHENYNFKNTIKVKQLILIDAEVEIDVIIFLSCQIFVSNNFNIRNSFKNSKLFSPSTQNPTDAFMIKMKYICSLNLIACHIYKYQKKKLYEKNENLLCFTHLQILNFPTTFFIYFSDAYRRNFSLKEHSDHLRPSNWREVKSLSLSAKEKVWKICEYFC